MGKPVLGILLEFGFHDVKKHIMSGFYRELAKSFDLVWLALDKGNQTFDNYFRGTGFPVVYFRMEDFNVPVPKAEARNASVRRAWMLNHNIGAFHNYRVLNKRLIKDRIIGNPVVRKFYERKVLALVLKNYRSDILRKVFSDHGISLILGISTSSTFSKSAFVTAHAMGIRTWLLVNSWKDLYVNDFIPLREITGILTWSEKMKSDYLRHMTYLDPAKIYVAGNPTFDQILLSEPKFPRAFYSEKYRLDPGAEWLCYTMSPPGIFIDEFETVCLIARRMLEVWSPKQRMILLRRNPNHSRTEFIHEKLPANLVLLDHYCEYDGTLDMIIQSPEGEQEWLDLLEHCTCNISVPSTVTAEFLLKNKRVYNVGFGSDGEPNPVLDQHLYAGFYKPLFLRNDVFLCATVRDLLDVLRTGALKPGTSREPVVITPEGGASRLIREILTYS